MSGFLGWPDPTSLVMTELWEKAAAILPPWEMGHHTDGEGSFLIVTGSGV